MDYLFIPIFVSGFIGGLLAYLIGLPMPFMLGGIFGTATFVLIYEQNERKLPRVSRWLRQIFMSLIGAIIGSKVTSDFFVILPEFWLSALMLLPFILLSHFGSYWLMVQLGNYNKRDAYFATLPGGIIDSVALAESKGADIRVVTTQHFIRVLMVVTFVPVLFFLVQGHAVGSAAGMTITGRDYDLADIGVLCAVAFSGLLIGKMMRLPASHMMGSLLFGATLSIFGFVTFNIPDWMPHLAQFVVGTALGSQFSGISRDMLVRGFRVGFFVGSYMLAVGTGFALLLKDTVPADFGSLFVCFAAGGLAEMSLIALSLNFNPVIVALHHLFRIIITVVIGNIISSFLFKEKNF